MKDTRKRILLHLTKSAHQERDDLPVYESGAKYSTPELMLDDDIELIDMDVSIKELIEDEDLKFRDYGDYTTNIKFESTIEQNLAREANEPHVRNVAIAHDTVTINLEDEKKPEKHTFKKWLKSMIPSKRRIAQLYAALLFNANLKGYVQGGMFVGDSKFICSPGINCYSCPGAIGTCPLGALQNSIGNRSFMFYTFGIIMLMGIMLGRTICGWLCPFGLFQDLLYKIKTPKIGKSAVTRVFSYLKYVILAVFVFLFSAVGLFPAFCKYICPAGILEGAFGLIPQNDWQMLNGLGAQFAWKFILLVTIIVACIFLYRGFFRFICPMGAIYSLFNKFSFFGIKLNKDKCTHCGKCISKCKLDIKHVGDHECISCGECISVCPTKAISWKGPKISVAPNVIDVPAGASYLERKEIEKEQEVENQRARKKNIKRGVIVLSIATVILAGVLIYFNVIKNDKLWEDLRGDTTETTDTSEPEGPTVGTKVGNRLPSASLQSFDENGLSAESIDPSKSGKVTVINFWGTWCQPCVKELPHFNDVATQYKDSVVFYAVHSDSGFDVVVNKEYGTALEYVAKNYADSNMIFLRDTNSSKPTDNYFLTVTGEKLNPSYPWTIVINESGVITYSASGEMSAEALIAEIQKASN